MGEDTAFFELTAAEIAERASRPFSIELANRSTPRCARYRCSGSLYFPSLLPEDAVVLSLST